MDDLIININLHDSVLYDKPVVEIFLGKIKFLKNKKFSGPLKKADLVTIDNCNNLTNLKLNVLKNIISNSANNQISKNRFLTDEFVFLKLLNEFRDTKCVYCRIKDNSLCMLEDIIYLNKEDLGLRNIRNDKKVKFVFKGKDGSTDLSAKIECVSYSNFSMIYDKNKLYISKNIINANAINKLARNNFIINSLNDTCFEDILYSKHLSRENVSIEKHVDIYDVLPIPIFYLEIDNIDKQIIGTLNFQYGTMEIGSNKIDECIYYDKYRYFRNKALENSYIRMLYEIGWKKSKGNCFTYERRNHIEKSINELLDKGFTVLTPDSKRFVSSNNINFGVSYNIDWFEIDGTIKLNDKEYKLSETINFKNKSQHFIEIDNYIITLPKAFLTLKKNITKSNNKLVVDKRNIGEILELANELKIRNIRNIESIIKFSDISLNIPMELKSILREYQVEGVKWLKYLYRNEFGGCLADDMGLGKTLQVIALLSDKDLSSPKSLVIVPKTLIYNWKKELEKFNKQIDVVIYHGKSRELALTTAKRTGGVILTTYGTVLNDIEKLASIAFNCLILDEVQFIKNSKSKTYFAIKKLKARVRIALSGTPIENNIGELWALMDLLNPNIFGKRSDFINKYSTLLEDKNTAKNLNLRIQPFILRRTKEKVLRELPDKIEQNIYCDMTPSQRELYDLMTYKIKEEIKRLPDRFEIKNNSIILEGLLYLRQICCHPSLLAREYNVNNCKESEKFEVFKQRIEELMLRHDKVVVFSQFTSMLKIMEKWIKTRKWKYYYLDGQTQNRQEIVEEFEKSKEGIFLISLKAGGVGLNLVSSQYAIIYDPWWNPAVENQAADRIHRIGQKRNVVILRFVTLNSIEEKIDELKKIKSDITDTLLDRQNVVKGLTMEDLRNLIG